MTMQRRGRRLAMGFVMAVAAAGAVAYAFGIGAPRDDGPPQKDMTVDAATRASLVDAAAAQLEQHYVFADKGRALAAQLRANLRSGQYDGISSAKAMAQRLTSDLLDLSKDKHMEVRYFEEPVSVRDPKSQTPDRQAEDERFHMIWMNGGFTNVGRLPGNLGYIDLHFFARPDIARPRIDAAMALVADSKALIVDLRHCEGGDPETVMLFADRLFDQRTHLNDIVPREGAIEARWAQPTKDPSYGGQRRIYLLTSADTISGCEDFAYALQANHRAMVLGEVTAGAANGGGPERIGEHFMMFVPSFRPINPITHANWEGTGVRPDEPSSADKAQKAAQRIALQTLLKTETYPDARQRIASALGDL